MKKILSLILVIVLAAGVAVTGTMAYLTDRDDETNVYTVGDVKIELEGDFAKGTQLLPGKNIDCNPVIKNTGKNDAWVWLTYAVPTELADVIEVAGVDSTWEAQNASEVDDEYTVYTLLHNETLAVGESTKAAFEGVKLAETVDITPDGDWYTVDNGVATSLNWTNDDDAPAVYVNAYAIQKDQFETVDEALAAYKGQWGGLNGEMEEVTVTEVATAEELSKAVATGGVVVLNADVELKDAPITISEDTTVNLNGKTLSGVATSTAASNMIKVAAGKTLTLSNGEVSFYATNPDTEWGGEGQPPFPGYANNTINVSGKLVLENVTVENTTAAGGASYAIDCYPGADLVINDGAVIKGYDKCAIRMFANSTTIATNVTINGGEITGKRGIWVHLPSSKVTPQIANLTINGGIVTGTASDDCAIYSYSYGSSFAKTNITITGGTFNGDVCFGGGYKGDQENVLVTGGIFNGELGRYLANDGWEEIDKPTATVDSADELQDALNAGQDVILGGDIDLSQGIVIPGV